MKKIFEGFGAVSLARSELILKCISISLLFVSGIQTFFFANFSQLQIREIDDLAFTQSIWKLYEAIQNFDIATLFGITDYGYGWIFWALSSLFSAPGYLLFQLSGDQFLIAVSPRIFSLLCVFGSWYLLKRISGLLGMSKWMSESIGLIYLLIPSVLWFGMRFGTVSLIGLFSLSSVYFLLDQRRKSRGVILGAILFGLAVGVKLSALVFLPVVIYLIYLRTPKIPKYGFWTALSMFSSWLVSAHPPLLMAFFAPWVLPRWIEIQRDNILNAGGSSGLEARFAKNFSTVFLSQPSYTLLFVLALSSAVIYLFQLSKKGSGFFAGLLVCISALTPLAVLSFAGNTNNAISYSMQYISITVIGIWIFTLTKPFLGRTLVLATILILLCANAASFSTMVERKGESMNAGYYYAKFLNSSDEITTAKSVESFLRDKNFSSIGHDYTAPVGVTTLQLPNKCIYVVFDNLNRGNGCSQPLDWIFLDSRKLSNRAQLDFEARTQLELEGKFSDFRYEHYGKIGNVDVFRRK